MKFETTVFVDKKVSVGNIVGRILCALLLVISVVVTIITAMIPMVLLALVFGFAFWFLTQDAKSEYEYSYIEGTLSFAKIRAKSKRKAIAEIDMKDVVLIAPSSAHELYNYHNNHQTTIRNCASGNSDAKTYEVVYKRGENTVIIVFEPNAELLDEIRKRYPRQVML